MHSAENGRKAAVAGPGPTRAEGTGGIGGRDPRRRVDYREREIKDRRRLLDAQGER